MVEIKELENCKIVCKKFRQILDEIRKKKKIEILAIFQAESKSIHRNWYITNDIITIPKTFWKKPETVKNYFSIELDSYDNNLGWAEPYECLYFDEVVGKITIVEEATFNQSYLLPIPEIRTEKKEEDISIRTWVRYYLHTKDAMKKIIEKIEMPDEYMTIYISTKIKNNQNLKMKS